MVRPGPFVPTKGRDKSYKDFLELTKHLKSRDTRTHLKLTGHMKITIKIIQVSHTVKNIAIKIIFSLSFRFTPEGCELVMLALVRLPICEIAYLTEGLHPSLLDCEPHIAVNIFTCTIHMY